MDCDVHIPIQGLENILIVDTTKEVRDDYMFLVDEKNYIRKVFGTPVLIFLVRS